VKKTLSLVFEAESEDGQTTKREALTFDFDRLAIGTVGGLVPVMRRFHQWARERMDDWRRL